jgi:hypothetical protein
MPGFIIFCPERSNHVFSIPPEQQNTKTNLYISHHPRATADNEDPHILSRNGIMPAQALDALMALPGYPCPLLNSPLCFLFFFCK